MVDKKSNEAKQSPDYDRFLAILRKDLGGDAGIVCFYETNNFLIINIQYSKLMETEFKIKGYWWLPTDPKNRIQGILKYKPNGGIHLETLGFFGGIQSSIRPNKYDIIHGINLNNKPITLANCYQTGISMRFPGFQEGKYFAHLLLVGEHFFSKEDMIFNEFYSNFAYLDEWVDIYGFKINFDPANTREYSIEYTVPDEIIANINENCSVSIFFVPEFNLPYKRNQLNPKQKTFFKIKFIEPQQIDGFLHLQHLFQDFLTLITGERSFPLEIFGISSKTNEKIDLFYNPISKIETPKELFPDDMIFAFPAISNQFEEILKNWFEKASLLRPVYTLYFATRYSSFIYVENRFLNQIQALETYHSRKYDKKYISEDICLDVYNKLISSIPDYSGQEYSDFKTSLIARLHYINEYSLRKRLKSLIKDTNIVSHHIIDNTNDFIDKVVNTRNYLTHYSRDAELLAVKGKDLFFLTEKVKILVEILLLRELGFPFEEIENFIKKNRDYMQHFVKKEK